MEARLRTGIWINALVRRCDLAAIPIAVVSRGDRDAGAILLKFNGGATGCSVLTQARGPDGIVCALSTGRGWSCKISMALPRRQVLASSAGSSSV